MPSKAILTLSLIITCIVIALLHTPVSAKEVNATILMRNNNWDRGVAIVTANGLYGTGWWVGDHIMVTAGHVVEYEQGRTVTIIHGSFETTGTVIKVDRRRDVAIIRTADMPRDAHIFPLATSIRKTEVIYVIGYPFELLQLERDIRRLTENPRIAQGTIAWIDENNGLAEITAHTDAGNSGGPVVDRDGNVVGLVSFALIGRASTLYFITVSPEIQHVLNQVNVTPEFGHISTETRNYIKYALIGGGTALITSLTVIYAVGRRKK